MHSIEEYRFFSSIQVQSGTTLRRVISIRFFISLSSVSQNVLYCVSEKQCPMGTTCFLFVDENQAISVSRLTMNEKERGDEENTFRGPRTPL